MSLDQTTKTLVQVIQDLSAARTLDDITSLVRKAAREIAQADGVTFALKDQDMCAYVDEEAIEPLWKGQRFPMKACVSGWAMIHKEAVVIEDIYQDRRVPIDAYRPTFVKSMAMTPIRQEDPIGAIGTYWKDQHRPTSEQLQYLQALANSASIALENVGLYNSLSEGIEQLKKANQAKDEFLMNLSHELRTPLNAIIGWAEILTENKSDQEQLAEGLQIILENSNHQLHIVEDLMDSSRILAGRVHLSPSMVDIHQVAKQSIAGQMAMIQKKNLLVDLRTEMNSAIIKVDPIRLRQIIDNILINAIKFSFPNGHIEMRLQKSGPNIDLSIQDHGEGIDSSLLPHIFERLKQGDGSLTRKYGGLGLGLSIAKDLTEISEGQIKASSAGMGKGAVFTLSFPLQDFELKSSSSEATTLSPVQPRKSLDNIHILVVDDDDDARQVAALALRNQGAKVKMAASVQDAMGVMSPDNFEVIVCDLSMPEEDGFSFVRKIREGKTPFQNHIPVLALTAFTDQGTKEKALHEGFDVFLEKPFKASYLVSTVAGAL